MSGVARSKKSRADTEGGPAADEPLAMPSTPIPESLQPGAAGVGVSIDVNTIEPKRIGGKFVYSVKFLSGKIPHSPWDPQDPPPEFALVPGTYRTAININNPNLTKAKFTKMALTTNPQGQPRGKAGDPVKESLGANEGMEIDYQDIEKLLTQSGAGIDLFNNANGDPVLNGPPSQPMFILNDPTLVNLLWTYHWNAPPGSNDGRGDTPGEIGLQKVGGAIFGPFRASGERGQASPSNPNGVPNASWRADSLTDNRLPMLLQPGSYRVVDSKNSTWSYDQASGFTGIAIVRGNPSFVGRAPFFKGFVVIRSDKQLDVVAVYTLKNVIRSVPYPLRAEATPTTTPTTPPTISVTLDVAGKSFAVLTSTGSAFAEADLTWSATGEPGLKVDVQVKSNLTYPNWYTIFANQAPQDMGIWPVRAAQGESLNFRAVAKDGSGNTAYSVIKSLP
jgi:hypothetical protein